MKKFLLLLLVAITALTATAQAGEADVLLSQLTQTVDDAKHDELPIPVEQGLLSQMLAEYDRHGQTISTQHHPTPPITPMDAGPHAYPEPAPAQPEVQPAQPNVLPLDTVEMDADGTDDHWQQELIMTNMRRDGSGTAWIPLDNPMLMKMGQWRNWTGMLHWSAFADYDHQTGPRGDNGFYSQNWIMASAMSPVKDQGVMHFRAMLSLEPLTVGKRGYPVLFQTGETDRGEPLIDRQHPHELFMELSAQYYQRVNDDVLLRFYLAPVGEPSLGPVAFPHRYSSFLNPDSPLGHHMQDSTHIAFGVATAGVIYKNKWQLEGSVFNGKEPDENRYDFDYDNWKTAYSGRLSYMPTKNWAIQTSYGYLKEPEALEPGNIHRLTSSIQHSKTWNRGWWASSLAWGHNFTTVGPDEDDILLESVVNFLDKNYVFGRVEHSYKHGLFGHHDEASGFSDHDSFHLTVFSLGIARDLFRIKDIPVTLGGMLTMFAKPGRLNDAYGNFPMGFHVFLHTNAPPMRMSHQAH
jgi:hypothetical protein